MANRGEKEKQRQSFVFLGSKNTVNSNCRHEIRRCLLLGRKAITNLDSTLKTRDITLATEVHRVKVMDFRPVQIWELTITMTERRNIDAFKFWDPWRVPWTARSNQSILKETNADISLQGLMLKLQYFGYLMGRADSLEKTLIWERLKAGEEGSRGWDG